MFFNNGLLHIINKNKVGLVCFNEIHCNIFINKIIYKKFSKDAQNFA